MNVRRLRIADHGVLQTLSAYLDTFRAPPPPFTVRGDLAADWQAGPRDFDLVRPMSLRRDSPLYGAVPALPPDVAISSLHFYPPAVAGLGWHTDSIAPGCRVFIGRPALGGAPGALMVPGEEFPDIDGTALAFEITGRWRESWHALRAPGRRFSAGIRMAPGSPSARALGFS